MVLDRRWKPVLLFFLLLALFPALGSLAVASPFFHPGLPGKLHAA